MKKQNRKEVLEFLEHNNRIEGVYDVGSFLQAEEAWKFLIKQKVMTPHIVLKTHKILMLHQNLLPDEKGYFRKVPVYIGGHEAMDYTKIPAALDAWIELMERGADPQSCHVAYEAIHPFVDGNGRTGRMFLNWQRLKQDLPFLIIHEGKEQMDYYKWFR